MGSIKFNFGGNLALGQKLHLAVGAVYGLEASYNVTDDFGASKKTFSPKDMMVGAAASFLVTDIISVGAGVSYLNQGVADGISYNVISANIAVAASISDFKFSLGAKSLGSQVESASGEKFNQALSVNLGGLWNKEISESGSVKAALEADYYTVGELGASLGAGYTFKDMLSLRAGYHLGGDKVMPSYASVGAGFSFKGLHIDAAYLLGSKEVSPSGSFIFGLGYRF